MESSAGSASQLCPGCVPRWGCLLTICDGMALELTMRLRGSQCHVKVIPGSRIAPATRLGATAVVASCSCVKPNLDFLVFARVVEAKLCASPCLLLTCWPCLTCLPFCRTCNARNCHTMHRYAFSSCFFALLRFRTPGLS